MTYNFLRLSAAALGLVLATGATAQTTSTATNANPLGGYQFGNSNNYANANSVVTSRDDGNGQTFQVYDRFHVRYQPANASDTNGVYSFNLGDDVGFDFGFSNDAGSAASLADSAKIVLTNLMTGAYSSFSPAIFKDNYSGNTTANGYTGSANNVLQNSQPLSAFYYPFFSSNGFTFSSAENNTYRVDFTAGGVTATSFAKFGSGFTAAVPEPATWAMMILGMGAIGFSMRRRLRASEVRFADRIKQIAEGDAA